MVRKVSFSMFLITLGVLSANSFTVVTENNIIEHSSNEHIPVAFLTRKNDSFYVTNITVGTPSQSFSVSFSNQIHLTAITSVNCDTCGDSNAYNHTKSTTANITNIIEKEQLPNPLKSTIEGLLVFDNVNLGGLDVKDQLFYEVEYEINCTFPVDGTISLAFTSSNIISHMYSQGAISNPIVGYFISSDSGEVSFGEPNPQHFTGNLSYFPIENTAYQWKIPLANYSINDEIISNLTNKYDYSVVFDVSVENIEVGDLTMKQINNAIGADLQPDGSYTVDCNTLDQYPSFSFIFGHQSFTLEPHDYINVKDNRCVSYFVTNPGFKQDYFRFVTGQPFFRKFYTVFDFGNKKIGFANAK